MSDINGGIIRMPRLTFYSPQPIRARVLPFPTFLDVRECSRPSPLEDPLSEFPIPPQAELRDSCPGCFRPYEGKSKVFYCRTEDCRYNGQTSQEISSQIS
ncbi:MAG: hypothetical protein WCP89_00585 [archaeon]